MLFRTVKGSQLELSLTCVKAINFITFCTYFVTDVHQNVYVAKGN